jgi:hypothetical protein
MLTMSKASKFHKTMDQGTGVIQSGQPHVQPLYDAGIYGQNEIVNVVDSGLAMETCFFDETGYSFKFDTFVPNARKVTLYTTEGGDKSDDDGHGLFVCLFVVFVNPLLMIYCFIVVGGYNIINQQQKELQWHRFVVVLQICC